jgi:hypothetical protein
MMTTPCGNPQRRPERPWGCGDILSRVGLVPYFFLLIIGLGIYQRLGRTPRSRAGKGAQVGFRA